MKGVNHMAKINMRKKNTSKKMPNEPKREVVIKAVAPIGKLHGKS
jgi:hypothetical protein